MGLRSWTRGFGGRGAFGGRGGGEFGAALGGFVGVGASGCSRPAYQAGDLEAAVGEASYGYQLIKTMEQRLGGGYTPSAGVIIRR